MSDLLRGANGFKRGWCRAEQCYVLCTLVFSTTGHGKFSQITTRALLKKQKSKSNLGTCYTLLYMFEARAILYHEMCGYSNYDRLLPTDTDIVMQNYTLTN